MHKQLEHQEHASHAAHSGNKRAALLVAVLAALLAINEQGAKHSEIRLQESAISTADAWAQYQAKSIRSAMARDLSDVVMTMQDNTVQQATIQTAGITDDVVKRSELVKRLRDDIQRYDHGPDGKDEIAKKAREFEKERLHSLEQTHSYDNAAAALEIGIVLATASAITASAPLVVAAAVLGVAGATFGLLGLFAPEYGAI